MMRSTNRDGFKTMATHADADSERLTGRLRHSLHELNNALTPILANAQLVRLILDAPESDAGEAVEDIIEAAGRANALVSEMREMARDLDERMEPGGDAGSNTSPTADDAGGSHG